MEEIIEEIKTDHFKTMEELLKHLKIWEEDGDYDAYYRFFCPRCAYELAHKIEKQQKEIENYQILKDDIEGHNVVYVDTPEFEEKYISKDKIKKLIKEKAKTGTYNFKTISIKDIKELLGE